MLYQDFITKSGKNLFTYLKNEKVLPIKEFDDFIINESFILKYGEREILTRLEKDFNSDDDLTMENLSLIIKTFFYDKWEKDFNIMLLDYGITSKETVTEKIDNNGNVVNNVSAYDSESLLKDNSEETEKSSLREYNRTTQSVQQTVKNLSLLHDRLINDIIFTDIRQLILKKFIKGE